MKEYPILFNASSINAIRDKRKSQTRRVVKPQPTNALWFDTSACPPTWYEGIKEIVCRYGRAGDHLWVRETCRAEELDNGCDGIRYRADDSFISIENSIDAGERWLSLYHYDCARRGRGTWVPSIHMPRWASRWLLENQGVRVERVQEISEADAIAEGIGHLGDEYPPPGSALWSADVSTNHVSPYGYSPTAEQAFGCLWNSIHAEPKRSKTNPYTGEREDCYVSYPWEYVRQTRKRRGLPWYVVGNPWVWVVKFGQIDGFDS